jgi:hypothetical protein
LHLERSYVNGTSHAFACLKIAAVSPTSCRPTQRLFHSLVTILPPKNVPINGFSVCDRHQKDKILQPLRSTPYPPTFNVGDLIVTTVADIRLPRTWIFFGRLPQNFSNIECGGIGGASALWKTNLATMCLVAIFCPLLVIPALVLTHGHTISNSFLDPSTCLPLCLFACLRPCLPACLPACLSDGRAWQKLGLT